MLGLFAIVAALLAAVGIYGVLAYAVVQRTQEIGVRMALGAQRGQVLTLVLWRGIAVAAIGIGIGLAAAAAGTRYLQGLLFGVTPLDKGTFALAALGFVTARGARLLHPRAPRDTRRSDDRTPQRIAAETPLEHRPPCRSRGIAGGRGRKTHARAGEWPVRTGHYS